MGHEFAGVVSAVGSGVSGVAEGDKVAVEPYYVCGECVRLRRGPLQHLPQARLHRAGRAGRRLRREVRGRLALDPPARRPAHRRRRAGRAARGGLPRGAAVRAASRAAPRSVFGAGPIGLVTAASLKAVGAGQVISVEMAAARKPKAPRGRGRRGARPDRDDVPDAVRELTGGAGADVAFECAGIDAVLAVGDRLGAARRHRGERGHLGPRGHRADERPGAVRGQRHRHRWPTAATTRTRSPCCGTGRSPPSSSSPAGSGWRTWSRAVSGS